MALFQNMQRLRALVESENFLSICRKGALGKSGSSLCLEARGAAPCWPSLSFFIFEGKPQCTVGVAGSREGCWAEHGQPPHSPVSSPGRWWFQCGLSSLRLMLATALGWGVGA